MIKSFSVKNLNQRMTFDLRFHEDINIVTGKNGSGKTTLLKLLWYAISGNLERIAREITFDEFQLVTDKITLEMQKEERKSRSILKVSFKPNDGEKKELERPMDRTNRWEEINEINRQVSRLTGSSVFFPTFRRIEGGFSIGGRHGEEAVRFTERGGVLFPTGVIYGEPNALSNAMNQLSDRMSTGDHRFVASISTDDISRLLTAKFADLTSQSNQLHMQMASYILEHVGEANLENPQGSPENAAQAKDMLLEIRKRARNVTQQSDQIKRPFTVLSNLISTIFQYKGIKIGGPVTLGETKEAILSDVLSAGEKQMLSFLCYNAFTNQTCLFIDEPEISLHVDWQRILFPVLLEQATGNQFIVATHSPFIYSKYSDKELVLAPRGDGDA